MIDIIITTSVISVPTFFTVVFLSMLIKEDFHHD